MRCLMQDHLADLGNQGETWFSLESEEPNQRLQAATSYRDAGHFVLLTAGDLKVVQPLHAQILQDGTGVLKMVNLTPHMVESNRDEE